MRHSERKSERAEVKKGNLLSVLFFCFAALLLCCSADAHALEFKKQTLPNGLTVLHIERNNLPAVMATLLIKASPLNEPADKAGLASLTAKMLMEGTKNRKASDISEEIEFIAASLDAGAGSDYTTISLSILKKDIAKGFDIFSDILLRPVFPEDELKRKKDLIKGSLIRSEEEPSFIAGREFIKEVFGSHPYGRLVTGSIGTIDKISREDVVNFYREHYLPDNAILSIVGNLTQAELDALIKKYLSAWGSDKCECGVSKPAKYKLPAFDKPKTVLIDKDITQANIILGHIGISRNDPDYYAVAVMNYILGGGGFASRLMHVVRDEMGLAYSIYSSFIGNKYPGQFEVVAQTKNESAATVVKEILKQMNKIRTEYITDQELQDAKAYLTGSFPRRLETGRKIADFLAAAQFYELGDDYADKYPGYIKSVTKEDVLRVAKKYLNPDNYALVIVGNKNKINLPELQ
jgi:zinc protease